MDHIEKPDDLLEENWFFGNSLDKKTKTMSRSYSDPNPMENEKISETKAQHNLMGAPSLPSSGKEKSSLRKPKTSLHRAPSLPPCVGRDEDAESEFSLSRLIRQASLTSSDDLPPKHYSKTKQQPENNRMETFPETKFRNIKVQNKLRRSVSDVKFQQVEEHKETYYNFDKKCKNPIEIPCFQEKPRIGYHESSSADDMKTQIKYWARAVAANVR